MGTHLRILGESFPMNTNMTGFKWFSKILAFFVFWTKVVPALEGLNEFDYCASKCMQFVLSVLCYHKRIYACVVLERLKAYAGSPMESITLFSKPINPLSCDLLYRE